MNRNSFFLIVKIIPKTRNTPPIYIKQLSRILHHKTRGTKPTVAKSHNSHCTMKLYLYFFRQRYNRGSPKQTVGSFVRKARVANSVIRTYLHHPSFSIHSEK